MDAESSGDEMIDAIEDGKIVKVSEKHAREEGLLILRTGQLGMQREAAREEKRELEMRNIRPTIDDFRKPLNWRENKVMKDLVDNFHWEISRRRREFDLSRKELASDVGVNENTLRMVENGVLPKDDFVLINKIQERLGINLRRDKEDFAQPMRGLIEEKKEDVEIVEEKVNKEKDDIVGTDIEIVDDEKEK